MFLWPQGIGEHGVGLILQRLPAGPCRNEHAAARICHPALVSRVPTILFWFYGWLQILQPRPDSVHGLCVHHATSAIRPFDVLPAGYYNARIHYYMKLQRQ
ncbi:MAG TPA: hypothetical protein VF265_09095 [Nevskiaceae bacterium]